jgi:chromosomal replication initiation ATPase DnaA
MITVAEIQYVVCEHYGVSLHDLKRRYKPHDPAAEPVQTGMYLSRRMVRRHGKPASYNSIGRRFGGRDQSTVRHAYVGVQHRIENDPEVQADVAALIDELRS